MKGISSKTVADLVDLATHSIHYIIITNVIYTQTLGDLLLLPIFEEYRL